VKASGRQVSWATHEPTASMAACDPGLMIKPMFGLRQI